jgi:hypothetical protein
MNKKFEEFVLGESGYSTIEGVVEDHCPSTFGLFEPDCCSGMECAQCWANAQKQWVKCQPIETTTEAPTEDGFYFVRERPSKGCDWGRWTIIEWYRGQLDVVGSDLPEYWDIERWERSVKRIQMPVEKPL